MLEEPGSGRTAIESGYTISISDTLGVIWRRLSIIILVAVLFAGAAAGYSLTRTPVYEASILILVGQEQGITEAPNDVSGLQQLTQTMTEAVESRPVAEAVIQRLDLGTTSSEFIDEDLSARQISATQFIQVSYKDTDPQRAQLVANTVGDAFSEQISEISPSVNTITATVWERAVAPEKPVSPNVTLNILAMLVAGLLLGTGLAFLLEYLDDRWRSPEEAEQISGVPTFGVIPEIQSLKGSASESKKMKR